MDEPIYRGEWDGNFLSFPDFIPISVAIPGASGIAVDNERAALWVTDTVNNTVHKVDQDGPLLGDIPLIGELFKVRGATMIERNLIIQLSAVLVDESARGASKIVIYDIVDTPVEETSWSEVKALYR